MARTGGLVTFEEFRSLWEQRAYLDDDGAVTRLLDRGGERRGWPEWPAGTELRQQREHLGSDGAAERILERGKARRREWIPWGE